MLLATGSASGTVVTSKRDWVAVRPSSRTWACEHRRGQVQCAARSGKRGIGDLHDPWREEERRQALLSYVQEVQPQSVAQFAEQTHPVVVQAMRQTVLNVVGSLPPQYFDVRISAVAESLAQLMLSIMTTGYMMRSAQFRLELHKSLQQLPPPPPPPAPAAAATSIPIPPAAASSPAATAAAPVVEAVSAFVDYQEEEEGPVVQAASAPSPSPAAASSPSSSSSAPAAPATAAAAAEAGSDGEALGSGPGPLFLREGPDSPYAPGVQKKGVAGEVLRWHLGRGEVERLPAAAYMRLLEEEVAALRGQLRQQRQLGQDGGSGTASTNLGSTQRSPGSGSSAPPAPPTTSAAAAPAGTVEVLGPEPATYPAPAPASPSSCPPLSGPRGQELVCVSPLPGFGERQGPGMPYTPSSSSSLVPSPSSPSSPSSLSSASAPATMGCGGIPLVVGSPLGLPRNELLDYLHGLQSGGSGGFKELACSPSTASGRAVKEAMELFVARLMGSGDPQALSQVASECSSVELSKVLFWLMAVGYTLKSIEARLDMEDGVGGSSSSGGGGGGGRGGGSPGANGGSSRGQNGGKGERKGGFGGLRGLLPGF